MLRRAVLALLALATLLACQSSPPSGRRARRAVEQAIDRFCGCGAWPGVCPVQAATEEQLACLDAVYAAHPDAVTGNALCAQDALDRSSDCLLAPGADCEACQNAWSLDLAGCPAIPMEVRREMDACLR